MKIKPASTNYEASPPLGATENRLPVQSPLAVPMFHLKKILVPVDFSDCSNKALQHAIPLAKQFGAELVLLHVIELCPFVPEMVPYDFEDLNNGCWDLQALKKLIDEVTHCSICIRTGTPHLKITAAARGLGADLIIISTHCRKGLNRRGLGSTTQKVVRDAPCPVLIVRERERDVIADNAWGFEMSSEKGLIRRNQTPVDSRSFHMARP